jgi:Ca2+-binding EF-hand superfamily protein
MSTAVANPFANTTQTISKVESFHPSAQQKQASYMNVELDVEKKLQAKVAKDRVRIKEFFIDFDKLRKGVVGEAAFRTCLGTMNFRFTETEIGQVISKWSMGNGLINYAGFCANIDQVFLDTVDDRAVIENSKSTANFTDDEKTMLVGLLTAIRTEIKNKRILIKPQFQDYDTSKCCHITTEQFRRVMKDIGLLPPTEEMFQVLVRKYFDKGNVREINYFTFCQDIDIPGDLYKLYEAKHPNNEPPLQLGQLRDAGSTFFKDRTAGLDVINNRFQQQRIDISSDPNDIESRI